MDQLSERNESVVSSGWCMNEGRHNYTAYQKDPYGCCLRLLDNVFSVKHKLLVALISQELHD